MSELQCVRDIGHELRSEPHPGAGAGRKPGSFLRVVGAKRTGEVVGRELGGITAPELIEYPIEGDPSTAGEVTDRSVLIDLVLVLIAGLEQQIADLSTENAALSADLEKREEALKRLRELTLGQPEA